LVETFKTNAFNASFNAFVLDRVIGPFGTCNGSLLVFLGWSTSTCLLNERLYGMILLGKARFGVNSLDSYG
jgi:hypothetical protein